MITWLLYLLPYLLSFMSVNLTVGMIGEYGMSNIKNSASLMVPFVLLMVLLAASVGAVVFGIIKKKRPQHTSLSLGLVMALNAYMFTETCTGSFFIKESFLYAILSPLFIYIFYLLGSALFKSPKIYYIVLTVFFEFFGVLQYFVFAFRGAPIRASDINNVASAMEISSDYSASAGYGPLIIALAVANLAASVLLAVFTKIKPIGVKPRAIVGGVSAVLLGGILLSSGRVLDYGVENRIIKFNFSGNEDFTSYRDTGNVYLFFLDVMNSGSGEPDGYSDKKAQEILSSFEVTDEKPNRTPTVIAIMDESFADFARLGAFDTDNDYMPFLRSLTDNTIKGYVTVSAYGGYSCNSEFEFLSGNTMGFFPMGSAAYTQYVKTKQDSLVSYFDSFGYDTVSMAGCSSTLWNLGKAYDFLGFENQFYQRDLGKVNAEYVNGKLSDATLFREAIGKFEQKQADVPMFLFMTTMQNHASYQLLDDPTIELSDIDDDTAEAYLSAIYETDKALKELITYFESVDEDVVIVFFGDHYPHIESFSEELLGAGLGSLSTEQNANLHQTPFFIWANYDIEEQQDVEISLNYLSNKLIEVCDMPKTAYQRYLDTVMEKVPSISAFGYKGENGKWYRSGEKSDYSDLLEEYNIVQYYLMFKKYEQ
ncbi:MAG: sulfatase-like hydrolase/transferase [Oscillospiraceae bacterium]|nr:sulfatase-like hydrolase/transferase [Oscillospiraceae bacterium]